MPTTLKNAPLVELVAEVRWQSALPEKNIVAIGPDNSGHELLLNTPALRSFFDRFSMAIAQLGFSNVQELTTDGSPFFRFQPLLRYTSTVKKNKSVMLQIGAGMVSIHAVKPYKSWDQFVPVINMALTTLIATRDESERGIPFHATSVRYVDAFTKAFMKDEDSLSFMRDCLGVKIALPSALTSLVAVGQFLTPFLRMRIPLDDGRQMYFVVGEGVSEAAGAGVLVDTTVATTIPTAATLDALMISMNASQKVIHDMFFKLTKKLSHSMQPQQVGTK